jgi:hypothetical protein
MIRSAARLLQRIRGAPRASSGTPPRRWVDELSDAGVSAAEWVARRQLAPRLYVALDPAEIARLQHDDPEHTQVTVQTASALLRHEFNLLGSGPYTPVDPDRPRTPSGYQPIDWYLDPIAHLRFPRAIPHTEWRLDAMRPGQADIKLPWELARCQHWPVLGQAYLLTGEHKFAVEIADELADFLQANPTGLGIHWTCTMDVALRAANWALALELVRSCPAFDEALWLRAHEALFDHGAFIEQNLENTYEVTSNHFLSNVVGLFYLAAIFRDLPRGQEWDRRCRQWLMDEMAVQVLPDGADYESSIPYHRLVTELFLGAARVAEFASMPLADALLSRLQQMVDFLQQVLRPDGLMPQVGDADDGRLHVLSGYGTRPHQDPRHLFAPAACLFQRADWMQAADAWGEWEAAWWGYPAAARPLQSAAAPVHEAGASVREFADAGLTVMRRGGNYLIITNGIVGTGGFGNHKHNDVLGFEYHVAGRPVLVDPGSFVYTSDPDARNLFRSTRSHNTLCVDDEEQNELRPEWLFRLFEKSTPVRLRLEDAGDVVRYCGRHTGYQRLTEPVSHTREFSFDLATGGLQLVDHLEGRGRHRLRWHFHFAPGVEIDPLDAARHSVRFDDVALILGAPQSLTAARSTGWYSPSYGVRHACSVLDFETMADVGSSPRYVFSLTPCG